MNLKITSQNQQPNKSLLINNLQHEKLQACKPNLQTTLNQEAPYIFIKRGSANYTNNPIIFTAYLVKKINNQEVSTPSIQEAKANTDIISSQDMFNIIYRMCLDNQQPNLTESITLHITSLIFSWLLRYIIEKCNISTQIIQDFLSNIKTTIHISYCYAASKTRHKQQHKYILDLFYAIYNSLQKDNSIDKVTHCLPNNCTIIPLNDIFNNACLSSISQNIISAIYDFCKLQFGQDPSFYEFPITQECQQLLMNTINTCKRYTST